MTHPSNPIHIPMENVPFCLGVEPHLPILEPSTQINQKTTDPLAIITISQGNIAVPILSTRVHCLLRASAIYLLGLASPLTASPGPIKVFASSIAGAVNSGTTSSKIIYRTYTAKRSTSKLANLDHCLLVHGYIVSEARHKKLLEASKREAAFDKFVAQYFGDKFIQSLASGPCSDVTVLIQEAISTTALEMAIRTEEFLRLEGCKSGRCGIFGHSKGGLTATNLARRCMEKTSEAGESTCNRIHKYYSAAGNNLGTSYAALIYGLHLDDPHHANLNSLERQSKMFQIDIDLSPTGMNYIPERTNPIWVDISPIAPMENSIPLAIKNNILLNRTGWLVGDYGAGATRHDFESSTMQLFGCGPLLEWQTKAACTATGLSFGGLHKKNLRPDFERGLAAWKLDERFLDPQTGDHSYLNQLSWRSHQRSDGMAEFDLAMTPCFNDGTAVTSCTQFQKANHAAAAGSGPEVASDVLRFFSAPVGTNLK